MDRFRAALDASSAPAPGSIEHALQEATASPALRRAHELVGRLAEAALADRHHDRPERILLPAKSLPPLP